jgi:chemotaxis protein methyltransferase CheR/two-component system CheB/CheR fusion protein
LEASQRLLTHLPNTGRLACVVANHQAVDGHTEILVRQLGLVAAGWEVKVAENGEPVLPGKVYVIPAGQDGKLVAGRLVLQAPDAANLSSPSVNLLLASIAVEFGPQGIGVILSGTGSDGVAGCRALRGRGGSTFAQSDARFEGMPRAVEAALVVGQILPAHLIAGHLARLGQPSEPPSEIGLPDLVDLVLRHTGHDFSGYKPETLSRRAQARMAKLDIGSLAQYLDHLRRHPVEVKILQEHFLVSLSSFFRDQESFDALRGPLEAALRDKETVSIWTPACASGEESYSLAILTKELLSPRKVTVKVLASDLNPEALAQAERGLYPETAVKHLQPDLVARHFQRTGQQYQVNEELRAMCTFRCQDVIRTDAPHDLDLISCRNLLIYFRSELQNQLIRKFHQALLPEGLLFIGPAETLGPQGHSLFRPLDVQHRIYRRRPGPG